MDDLITLRRHRGACPHYRERWFNSGDVADPVQRAEVLYEAYCLQDTPPRTLEEQYRCLRSNHYCWRHLPQYRPRAGGAQRPAPPSTQ